MDIRGQDDEPHGISCDHDCLCNVINDNQVILGQSQQSSIDVEEIYQVLGRHILKSSLIDDIELYLECEEDNSYHVPCQKNADGSKFYLPRLPKNSNFRFKVSFPSPPSHEVKKTPCEICGKILRRATLLKDHMFREHSVQHLFACEFCPYRGSMHRHLQKHLKRKHSSNPLPGTMATAPTSTSDSITKDTCKPVDHLDVHGPRRKSPVGSLLKLRDYKVPGPGDSTIQVDIINIDGVRTVPNKPGQKTETDCYIEIHRVNEGACKQLASCSTGRYSNEKCILNENGKGRLVRNRVNNCSNAVRCRYKFTCDWPDCQKSFRDNYNLRVHRKTHQKLKDIKCSLCEFKCVQTSSLRWHTIKKH